MADNSPSDGRYELSGYRYKGGEWRDVEAGAPLPRGNSWEKIAMVTINLAPDTEEGFYRTGMVIGGLDHSEGEPHYNWNELAENEWTLDDMAHELALEYGFHVA